MLEYIEYLKCTLCAKERKESTRTQEHNGKETKREALIQHTFGHAAPKPMEK